MPIRSDSVTGKLDKVADWLGLYNKLDIGNLLRCVQQVCAPSRYVFAVLWWPSCDCSVVVHVRFVCEAFWQMQVEG